MTTLETLKAARAKIADPEHWTQGLYARGKSGRVVTVKSRSACQWCAMGAIAAVSRFPLEAIAALSAHAGDAVWAFNDSHTHAEVLALFDKAIAEAE